MFDLLPNNHANRSEAKTRRRVKCTGAVGRGKKSQEQGPGQEGLRKIKGAEGLAERPGMSSIQAVEIIAHLYHSIRLPGMNNSAVKAFATLTLVLAAHLALRRQCGIN